MSLYDSNNNLSSEIFVKVGTRKHIETISIEIKR